MRMQTIPVMTSVKSSVSPCGEAHAAGTTVPIQPAISAAVDVTMKDSLKPTPVRVTTPTTMPTVAAAAPTARAYLAPSRRLAAISSMDSRLRGLSSPTAMQRSEEHTSELQSLMRISYAVCCLKKKKNHNTHKYT